MRYPIDGGSVGHQPRPLLTLFFDSQILEMLSQLISGDYPKIGITRLLTMQTNLQVLSLVLGIGLHVRLFSPETTFRDQGKSCQILQTRLMSLVKDFQFD